MPFDTTVLDDALVVRCIPNSHPRTYDRRGTIEFVLIDAFAFHLLARCESSIRVTLIQHRIRSSSAVVTLIVHITQEVFVSGNSSPIHVELSGKLSYL